MKDIHVVHGEKAIEVLVSVLGKDFTKWRKHPKLDATITFIRETVYDNQVADSGLERFVKTVVKRTDSEHRAKYNDNKDRKRHFRYAAHMYKAGAFTFEQFQEAINDIPAVQTADIV